MSRTYKTTDPATLAALHTQQDGRRAVGMLAEAFGHHFGADSPVYTNTMSSGFRVHGLRFKPFKDTTLWTAPDKQSAGSQRPRAKAKAGATKEQRAELKALQADWELKFPKDVAEWEPVMTALGTDWGATWLSGFAMFEHDGAIYIQTGAKLAEHCVEILVSEYEAAHAAYKEEKA